MEDNIREFTYKVIKVQVKFLQGVKRRRSITKAKEEMLEARLVELAAIDENKKAKKGKNKVSGAQLAKKLHG
jgi:hypothetical protein